MCILTVDMVQDICHNLSLGLVTKVKASKGEDQEGRLGVTFHVPENARKCEGMNLHTPKWALTLEVGVSLESRIFREQRITQMYHIKLQVK